MCVAELERVDAVCRHVLGTVAVYVRLYRVEYARDGVLWDTQCIGVTRSLVHSAHDLCMLAGDRLCVLDLNHRRDLSGTRLTWMVLFRKSARVTHATNRPKSTRCDLPRSPRVPDAYGIRLYASPPMCARRRRRPNNLDSGSFWYRPRRRRSLRE